jgi:serine/threonine protein phosphatase 1
MAQLFVVGDIHGCATELEALLRALPVARGDTIVFVGDYIDRGPASAEAVRLVLDFRRESTAHTVFLKGNHEDMFLAYMGYPGLHGDAFLFNGGAATLASYGIPLADPGRDVAAALPAEHLAFFRELEPSYLTPPFLITHAGIDPDRSLADQREVDLLWIRERFIARPHGLPYTVCFGHTPRREVLIDLPYKIGLDTGCVYGNKLSCIELTEPRLFQVPAGGQQVDTESLHDEFRLLATR